LTTRDVHQQARLPASYLRLTSDMMPSAARTMGGSCAPFSNRQQQSIEDSYTLSHTRPMLLRRTALATAEPMGTNTDTAPALVGLAEDMTALSAADKNTRPPKPEPPMLPQEFVRRSSCP
jgi:hypothetical protein